MPTDTERRLDELERLLFYGTGVGTGALVSSKRSGRALRRGLRALVAGTGRTAGRLAVTGGRMGLLAARAHPVGAAVSTAATLAYLGYIHRDDIMDVAEALGEIDIPSIPGVRGSAVSAGKKRSLSKANRAVKYGMDYLKAGTKATTGADRGVVPIGAFKTATKAAGLANPNTKGNTTGKGKIKALARKIKKWWNK